MTEKVRVRFAPSPTGFLHVGGVRTALFNWLFARNMGGVFVLRIDDTDPERSKKEYLDNILEAMKWLGLDWDEGPGVGGPYAPYFESERMDRYKTMLDQLLAGGKAFKCWCNPAEIDEMRRQAAVLKRPPRYDGHCLNLRDSEREAYEREGRKPVVRFRLPDGPPVVLEDIVRGRIEFPRDMLDHFVIARSDGKPVYNFTTVLDEADLHITHVIRGDDHLSNTPKQVLLGEAMGFAPPRFAHLPQILGMDKARLSKRHGAAAVLDLRGDGYLPGCVLNFLALLGWSYNEKDELFTLPELVKHFSLDRVGTAPAVFNSEKLEWMNGVYIRKMPADELQADLSARLREALGGKGEYDQALLADPGFTGQVANLLKDGLKVLAEVVDQGEFFYRHEVEWEEATKAKFLGWPKLGEILSSVITLIANCEPYKADRLEASFRVGAENGGFKFKDFVHPTRFAITGHSSGPSLFHLMEILGKEKCADRMIRAIKIGENMNTGVQKNTFIKLVELISEAKRILDKYKIIVEPNTELHMLFENVEFINRSFNAKLEIVGIFDKYRLAVVTKKMISDLIVLDAAGINCKRHMQNINTGKLASSPGVESIAKDFYFELSYAAKLQRAGFKVSLEEPDIHIRGNDGTEYLIACKHVYKKENILDRMLKAQAQIIEQHNKHPNAKGVIAVSLDDLNDYGKIGNSASGEKIKELISQINEKIYREIEYEVQQNINTKYVSGFIFSYSGIRLVNRLVSEIGMDQIIVLLPETEEGREEVMSSLGSAIKGGWVLQDSDLFH